MAIDKNLKEKWYSLCEKEEEAYCKGKHHGNVYMAGFAAGMACVMGALAPDRWAYEMQRRREFEESMEDYGEYLDMMCRFFTLHPDATEEDWQRYCENTSKGEEEEEG